MNNSSIFTADRATHLKTVVVSLLCATIVTGIGIAARVTDASNVRMEASVVKAGNRVRDLLLVTDEAAARLHSSLIPARIAQMRPEKVNEMIAKRDR
jgi:hypothetical protein